MDIQVIKDKYGNNCITVDGHVDCYVHKYADEYSAHDSRDGDLFISSKYIDGAIEVLQGPCFDIRFRIADDKLAVIRKFNNVSVEVHTIHDDGELLDELDVLIESLPIIASIFTSLITS